MAFNSHFLAIYVCIASFLSLNNVVQAQTSKKEASQYRYVFKGYLRFFYENKSIRTTDFSGNVTLEKVRNAAILPTIGIAKYRKDGQFFELSLTNFNFFYQNEEIIREVIFGIDSFGNRVTILDKIPSRGAEILTNHLGLRLERSFPLLSNKNNRFQPVVGLSCDPSVFYQSTTPFTSAAFPTRVFELSNTVAFIPRLTYAVSNRFLIDLNVPISLVKFAFDYRYDSDPRLPTFARETTGFSATLLSKMWAIRLGLGYRFN